jgi:flagellar basal-body rod protein FlgC
MSLFSVLAIGASGMAAQRARAELLAENLASADTTHTPEGSPYGRKDAVFASAEIGSLFASAFQSELENARGVNVDNIVIEPDVASLDHRHQVETVLLN